MVDDKTTSAGKPAADTKPREHEFVEWDRALTQSAQLQSVLSMLNPTTAGLGAVLGAARLSEIQIRHAFIPEEEIHKGEWKGFQVAFDKAYRNDRLPDVKTPTRTGLFIEEESPKEVTSEKPFVHGYGVTAFAMAASKALTGQNRTIQLINRLPLEGELGTTWEGTSKTPAGSIVHQIVPDLAEGTLRKSYQKNSINIFSVSMVSKNPDMKTAKDRIAYEKKLSEYFGEHSVFVVASGNEETQKDTGMRHNALRHHPATLVVGAANMRSMIGPDGKDFNAYTVADYSTSGADVVMLATPHDARYAQMVEEGLRHLPQSGTSSATPQAAALVEYLVSRFAASKENPDAVLSEQDVVLALKNTAQPLIASGSSGYSYDFKIDPPPEDQHARKTNLFPIYKVGNHYVSLEAGNGVIDPKAAWALLEKQEKEVRAGNAKVLARENVTVSLVPKEHSLVTRDAYAKLPATGPTTYYRYPIAVGNELYADQIVIDLESKNMGKKLKDAPGARPRLFLVNPAGDVVEVAPSSGYNVFTNSNTGAPMEVSTPYIVARPAGMQGSAMKGTWNILCTEPLDTIALNFDRAMQPEHVGVTITPDTEERARTLYRHVDFTPYSREKLEEMLNPNSPMLNYDLSETGFPAHFMDIRLAMLAESDKKTALQLVDARYGKLKDKDTLVKAVESGDGKKVLDALIPPKGKFQFFKELAATESKEAILFLVNHGFANVKDENVAPGINPSTALMEMVKQRSFTAEPELVQAFMKAGADIRAKDAKGRTVLHYAQNGDIQKILMDPDLNGPHGTRLFEQKDNDGKTYDKLDFSEKRTSLDKPGRYFVAEAHVEHMNGPGPFPKIPVISKAKTLA